MTREKFTKCAWDIFVSLGADKARTACLAEHLVEANRKGHDSHGVSMIPGDVADALKAYPQTNPFLLCYPDQWRSHRAGYGDQCHRVGQSQSGTNERRACA